MVDLIIKDGVVVMIDDDDFEYLSQFRWKLNNYGYVYRTGTKYDTSWNDAKHPGKVYMSRCLMGLERGDKHEVDHINRNPLDNRKVNLRIVERYKNTQNRSPRMNKTSIYKGVYLFRNGKWHAQIAANKKKYHIGYFDNEVDAAKAYDECAKKIYGEHAYLNFKHN